MALFENFPYTDLQNINLGWIIQKVIEALKEVDHLSMSFDELKTYVLNYLKELDIDKSVKEYLDELVASGEFEDIITNVLNDYYMNYDTIAGNSLSKVFNFLELTDDRIKLFDNIQSMTSADFIQLFDSLISLSKRLGTMTKNIYGYDDFNNPLVYYEFTPLMLQNLDTNTVTTNFMYKSSPTLFITSGVHGNEKNAVASLYLTLRTLFQTKEAFSALSRTKMFILPCVNPSGINLNSRNNGNGVDVNRNFPTKGWTQTETSGTSAGDQKETQFVMAIANQCKSIFLNSISNIPMSIDVHNFIHIVDDGTSNDGRMLYAVTSRSSYRGGFFTRLLQQIQGYLKSQMLPKYPDLKPADNQHVYQSLNATDGSSPSCNSWFFANGFNSMLLELPFRIDRNNPQVYYSPTSLSIDVFQLDNYLFQLINNNDGYTEGNICRWEDLGLVQSTATLYSLCFAIPLFKKAILPIVTTDNIYNELNLPITANATIEIEKCEVLPRGKYTIKVYEENNSLMIYEGVANLTGNNVITFQLKNTTDPNSNQFGSIRTLAQFKKIIETCGFFYGNVYASWDITGSMPEQASGLLIAFAPQFPSGFSSRQGIAFFYNWTNRRIYYTNILNFDLQIDNWQLMTAMS